MLGGAKALLVSALVGRLYYLQVLESDRYRTLADENRINLRLIPPPRGRIVDRFGIPLAHNRQNYRVVLISEQTPAVAETLKSLSRIVPVDESDSRRVLRETKRKRGWVPVTVRENLTWEEVARIEVNAPDLPGLMIDVGQSRYYPHGLTMAHVLGYVAAVSEAEAAGDRLLLLPGFRIGKNGVEKIHDLALRGTGGSSQVEVNAFGRIIRELSRQEGQPGAEVRLSLDLATQTMVSERLPQRGAAAVVMDVHSGEVLALTSSPAFDPNAFNRGLTSKEWRSLSQDVRHPLIDKAISGQYAPGSTFKMVVAMAALEAEVISPDTGFFCNGALNLGNARFHCWKRGGHGSVSLRNGLKWSCDVYFYEVAKRVGIDRIAAMAQRLGLGAVTGVDLPGEQPGLVPTRGWKQAVIGAPWQKGETLITGIGQGYMLATPLQLAVMIARLVNGGNAVTPRLSLDEVTSTGVRPRAQSSFPSLGLRPAHLELMRDAMNAIVNEPRGTAHRSMIKTEGQRMGGKTGTSQVRRVTKAERERGVFKNEDLPFERRDHALFVGFAPVEAPRYAVSVVVEHGGGGSRAAAPIARDVLKTVQERFAAPTARLEPADDTGGDGRG